MVSGRDIMQGIDAFTKMNKAMQSDPRNDYYRYMLNRQKCINANYSRTYKAAMNGQPDPGPDPDCMFAASGGGSGSGANAGYPMGNSDPYLSVSPSDQVADDVAQEAHSGGRIQHFKDGGMVHDVPHFQAGGLQEGSLEDAQAIDTQAAQRPPPVPAQGDPLFDMVNQVAPHEDIIDGELPTQINQGQRPVMSAELLRQMKSGSPTQRADAAKELARREAAIPTPGPDPVPMQAPVQGPDAPPARNAITAQRDAILAGQGAPAPALDTGVPPPAAAPAGPQEERTSAIGRAIRSIGGTPEEQAITKEIMDLTSERHDLNPGWFKQTTPTERATIAQRQAAIDSRIGDLQKQLQALQQGGGAPAGAPVTTPATAAQGAVAPGGPVPPAQVTTPAVNAGRPNTTLPPQPMTPQSVAAGIQTNPTMLLPAVNPAGVTGRPAPATGPASPAGRTTTGVSPQAAAGAGTSTPGGMANAPIPSPVPGALSDQRRTAAFNPATEQGIGAVDASGRDIRGGAGGGQTGDMAGNQDAGLSTNNGVADFAHATLGAHNTAVQAIKSGQATPQQIQQGWGAASPRATNAILQRYGGNGALTPGTAMVAGMTAVYMRMLETGDIAGAGRMAFSIVQRANVEAAKNGEAAVAAMQNGHPEVAKQFMVRGLDWTTDGTHVNLSPDRQKLWVTDVNGKVSTVPLDGRVIMAASQGLQNGTMLWNMINRHAASMTSRDKDPVGTQLKHMKMRYEIENVQARTARTRSLGARGGGGGGASSVLSQIQSALSGKAEAPAPQIHVNVEPNE